MIISKKWSLKVLDDDKEDDENIAQVLLLENYLQEKHEKNEHMKKNIHERMNNRF